MPKGAVAKNSLGRGARMYAGGTEALGFNASGRFVAAVVVLVGEAL